MLRQALIFLLFASSSFLPAQNIPLAQALEKGLVSLEAAGLGGHTGECLQATVTNIGKRPLRVVLAPGMVFRSQDTALQDLLVVDNEEYLLAANQKRTFKLNGYCCEMYRGGPAQGSVFQLVNQTPDKLSQVATYLYRNYLDKSPVAQQAVWSVSDNADLSAVWDRSQPDKSKKLIEFLAQLTGRPVPWYRSEYAKAAPGPQMAQRPMMMIEADWEFSLPENDSLSLAVFNAEGQQVDVLMRDKLYSSGIYTFTFSYKTNRLPKGVYWFRMHGKKLGLLNERKLVF
jgi:hypothetical protein